MLLLPPEIDQFLKRWAFAVASGDIPSILALCTDDIESCVNGAEPVRGATEVAAMLHTVFAHQRMERETTVRRCHVGGDLAVLMEDVIIHARPFPDGEPAPVPLREVNMLKRVDGQWKMAFNMNVLVPSEDIP